MEGDGGSRIAFLRDISTLQKSETVKKSAASRSIAKVAESIGFTR